MIEKNLVKNLRSYRKLKGLTQAEVAERADISPRYYQQLESGGVWPSPKTIESLSKALGISASSLFRDVSSSRFSEDLSILDASEILSKLANAQPLRRSFALAVLFDDKALLPSEVDSDKLKSLIQTFSKFR